MEGREAFLEAEKHRNCVAEHLPHPPGGEVPYVPGPHPLGLKPLHHLTNDRLYSSPEVHQPPGPGVPPPSGRPLRGQQHHPLPELGLLPPVPIVPVPKYIPLDPSEEVFACPQVERLVGERICPVMTPGQETLR